MNYYNVTLVYDLFIITTFIYADNEEEAKRYALPVLEEGGVIIGEPQEYQIEHEGSLL